MIDKDLRNFVEVWLKPIQENFDGLITRAKEWVSRIDKLESKVTKLEIEVQDLTLKAEARKAARTRCPECGRKKV